MVNINIICIYVINGFILLVTYLENGILVLYILVLQGEDVRR